MKRIPDQAIALTMAIILHGGLAFVLIFGLEFSRPEQPIVRLAVTATLVSEEQPKPKPQPVRQPEPEPEPEQPAQVDEEARKAAEESKRQEDLAKEKARIEAENKRKEEARLAAEQKAAEERRKQAEEAERKRKAEEERKRREEQERQRKAEEERKRREAEEARRKAEQEAQFMRELEEEEALQELMTSGLRDQYYMAIMQKIRRNWVRPPTATPGTECIVNVRQAPSGDVLNVTIVSCNRDEAVRRSVEAAVYKASPLPAPPDPRLFKRDLQIGFKPEQ